MARPQRNNADYFSHDANFRNDPRIRAVRNKFGLAGYGVVCMMLEILTFTDGFTVEWNEFSQEIYAGDIGVSASEMQEIVSFCVRINFFCLENTRLLCPKLTDDLRPLLDKRQFMRQKHQASGVSDAETPPDQSVSEAENPQSKVKDSIVKKDTQGENAGASAFIVPPHVAAFNLPDTIATLSVWHIPAAFVENAWLHYASKGWLLSEGVHVLSPADRIRGDWNNPDKRKLFVGESNGTHRNGTGKTESAYTKRLGISTDTLAESRRNNSWLGGSRSEDGSE